MKVDAVGTDFALLCLMHKQQIKLFQRVRHSRQETASFPPLDRRQLICLVRPAVIGVKKKRLEQCIERFQCEARFSPSLAGVTVESIVTFH